jgi:hypothetical protein
MSPNLPPTRLLPPVPLLLLLDPPLLMLMLVLMLMLELLLKLPLFRTPMPQFPELPTIKSPIFLRTWNEEKARNLNMKIRTIIKTKEEYY